MKGKVGPCRVLRPDDWIGCKVVGFGGFGVGGCVLGLRIVGDAMKEGKGG